MTVDVSNPDSSHNAVDWTALNAEDALPKLLDAHGPRIYRLATKLCGNPTEAEDLVQDVFLQAFRKWHQFQGQSSPSTWLYTIAARACTRRKRRRSGEPAELTPLSELDSLSRSPMEGPVLDLAPATVNPLDQQIQRQAKEAVEEALGRLPLGYRIALVLKDIVELSTPQIAGILGLKPATVKTRVHRARLLVRDHMLHHSDLPQKEVPPTVYSKRICMDLLKAKQEALDRGVPFPVRNEEVCTRCEAFFDGLDFTHGVCRALGEGELPPSLRQELESLFASPQD